MNAVRTFLFLLLPLLCRAQDATLASLTDATFSKWLTGTEWKGTLGTRHTHLWFATPGIVIVRWEFNPDVWDCRAAALLPGEKGKVKWRWNPDAVASCTCAVSEDLKSLALEDGLLGKWTLAPSARKAATVTGGKLATMGAAGFSSWLEKQGLRWRDAKLNFSTGRTATYEGYPPGKFEIVSPGVVEVYPLAERSGGLLVIFTPALDGALIYANWGVAGAKIEGAPETAIVPAPIFNYSEPKQKSLSAMSKEDFEKWLVGTEWEHTDKDGLCWQWFPVPGMVTKSYRGEHFAFGMESTKVGLLKWKFRGDPRLGVTMKLGGSLADGEITWEDLEKTFKLRLIARRMPFPMHVPSAATVSRMLPDIRARQHGFGYYSFPGADRSYWTGDDGQKGYRTLVIPGPGMVVSAAPEKPWDCALFVFTAPTRARFYNPWSATDVAVESLAPNAAVVSPDTSGGLFDMGLDDTKAITVKNPTASINALVVMDLGGGRMAGALSKLSLTSLALTTEGAASIGFNQPVGADMKKALREVTRYQAIRQQGWPRGQKMELTFADKYSPKDGPSAAVACALLLESALRGVALQPDFAVTGDMNADGTVQPIGGVAGKLRGATKGGCKVVAIPDKNVTEATDLALTDGAAPFLGVQVFSITHFDDAVKLAVRDEALLKAAMDSFTAIAAKIKAAPAALRQPDTVAALRNLSRQVPTHLSARLLLALAEDKLPAALSPSGSLDAIELSITDAVEGASQELLAKSNPDRGKVSAARSRLQQLRGRLDKRTHSLTDAWIAWCQSVERLTAGGGKVDESTAKEHNATVSRINAEEAKLRANADFREDLMR